MTDFEAVLRSTIIAILGFAPDPVDFSFVPGSPEIRARLDGDRLDIAYVAIDPLPPSSFWGEATHGRVVAFTSIAERDLALAKEAALALAILPDERIVPLAEAPAETSVYLAPALVSLAVAEGRKSLWDACGEAAEAVAGHKAWQAGELCGVAVERYRMDRRSRTIDLIDADPHWLHLDAAGAARHLDEILDLRPTQAPGPSLRA